MQTAIDTFLWVRIDQCITKILPAEVIVIKGTRSIVPIRNQKVNQATRRKHHDPLIFIAKQPAVIQDILTSTIQLEFPPPGGLQTVSPLFVRPQV